MCDNAETCTLTNPLENRSTTSLDAKVPNEKIPFWTEDPNILFLPKYILEFFPTSTMTLEQKLNALSRLILILTVIGFVYSRSLSLLLISAITLTAIWFMYRNKSKSNTGGVGSPREYFDGGEGEGQGQGQEQGDKNIKKSLVRDVLSMNNVDVTADDVFDTPSDSNPFSNVLMTDYDYHPTEKPAPPSYNGNINKTILEQAKQAVANNNPGQPNIADKLFRDLGDQYLFEQSLHSFHTTPNTTIPNDQNGFADFCYGSMISCKEGNMFACARNLARHQTG